MTYILHIINPGNTFNQNLKKLIDSCSLTEEKEMGFVTKWRNEPIWKL